METRRWDWAVRITACLGFGGMGAVVILCFLIGFGIHTFVGKEALYVCFALQGLNLIFVRCREWELRRAQMPAPSKKMRQLHGVFAWTWRIGAALLLLALLLGILGMRFDSFWIRYPCLFGTILTPVGWLGALIAYHRRRQAAQSLPPLGKGGSATSGAAG